GVGGGAGEGARPMEGIGPIATSLQEMPALELPAGVVIANELLDNLPFRIVERAGGAWSEVRVGNEEGRFVEVVVPASLEVAAAADGGASGVAVAGGGRLPGPTGTVGWVGGGGHGLRAGLPV